MVSSAIFTVGFSLKAISRACSRVKTKVPESAAALPEDVSREEAFGAMVVNFLRGLSTVKGLQVIDEILAREPRPKTLKQRREERELREGSVNENN